MSVNLERSDLNFYKGRSSYFHTFRDVRPEYFDNLRMIAAVLVFGRILTPEELGSMAELRMGVLESDAFNARFPSLEYRLGGTERLAHESLGNKATSWARLSYIRAGLDAHQTVVLEVDSPIRYIPLLPDQK